jgi:hypothetical protein
MKKMDISSCPQQNNVKCHAYKKSLKEEIMEEIIES